MVWSSRSSGVRFWSWTASISVHLVALVAFGFVRFSGVEAGAERPVPTAKVNQIKRLVGATPVVPKPRVKSPAKEDFAKRGERSLPVNQAFRALKPVSKDWPSLTKPVVSMSEFSSPGNTSLREGVEFFGSFAGERKVCYIVDCSGSMRGVFSEVRKNLSESIGRLQPDQYFYIIFFGGDKLFEFGDGKLLRATEKAKLDACKFIDSIQPEGRTNALAAFKRAVQIRDSMAQSSAVVYFLTDGFELTAKNEGRFSQEVAELLAKFAPKTRINTIGFCPCSGDRNMLRTMARQSDGEFVLIECY